MPKKKAKKDKDFQKVKFKVGKKLPRAENLTSTAFRSKSIVIKEQLKETSTVNLSQDVINKSRNPQELLAHLQHYNPSFKLSSLNTIKAVMVSDPVKLMLHVGSVIDRVCSLSSDKERDIRSAALECLKSIFSNLNQESVQAFMPAINAHLRCAMTHLSDDVKLDSLQLMDILITTYPAALKMEIFKLTQNFLDLISTHASNGKRALKVSPNSKLSTAKWRQQAFGHLERLLSIKVCSVQRQQISDRGDDLECSHAGNEVPIQRIDDSMFMSISGLEEHTIRRREIGVSGEESDTVLLTQFVQEILPLLRETWVELVVSADGALISEAYTTIFSVVNILNLLLDMLLQSDIKDKQPVSALIKGEVKFLITHGFPLVFDDRKSAKSPKRSKTEASCSALNLKMCSLCNRLQCGTPVTRKYMNQLVKNSDEFDSIGANMNIVLSSLTPGEMVEKVIVGMIDKGTVSTDRIDVMIDILNQQISERIGICQGTGDALLRLARTDGIATPDQTKILTTVNTACSRNMIQLEAECFRPVLEERLLKLTKKYDSVGKEEKSQSADEMCQLRILFSMLHNVEEISEKELKILLNTIWRPYVVKPDLITLIMEILHQRTKDGGLPFEMYINFLCTLVRGSGDLMYGETELVHQCNIIAKAVFRHMNRAINPEVTAEFVEAFFINSLNNESLKNTTCYSLMMNSGNLNLSFLSSMLNVMMELTRKSSPTEKVYNESILRYVKLPVDSDGKPKLPTIGDLIQYYPSTAEDLLCHSTNTYFEGGIDYGKLILWSELLHTALLNEEKRRQTWSAFCKNAMEKYGALGAEM